MTDRDGEDQAFVDAISEWPDIDDGPTLAGFLLARIAEDENAARANEPESERYPYGDRLFAPTPFERLGGDLDDYLGGPLGAHAARWHPARVLAECEAKRRIVDEYRAFVEPDPDDGIAQYADDTPEDRLWPEYGGGVFSGLRKVLQLLALPYADHPDYQEAWRP